MWLPRIASLASTRIIREGIASAVVLIEDSSLVGGIMTFLAHLTSFDFAAIVVTYFLGVGSGILLSLAFALVQRRNSGESQSRRPPVRNLEY